MFSRKIKEELRGFMTEMSEFTELMRKREIYLKALISENKRLRKDNKALLDRLMAGDFKTFKDYEEPDGPAKWVHEVPDGPTHEEEYALVGEILNNETT